MNLYLIKARPYVTRLFLLTLASCVEPYLPEVVDAPTSYLVVDGFINGNGVTRITLTRTVNVASATAPPPEKGAKIFIMDEAGGRYALTEKASGTYQSDSLILNPLHQYQLRLTTRSNVGYASDLVPLKVTPPIEALTWRLDGDRIELLLSTHDAQQQSRYYRWGCVETWEFNSAFNSVLEYDKALKVLVKRTTPIYTCWRTERLSTIMQGSSAHLSQDALVDFSYYAIARRAERLKIRYSALVSQYAETAEEFAYYELLRKNTEAVGTVNDPLPTQLSGNVHRLDSAAEPVLGFVSAHTTQQKRLFISTKDLPTLNSKDYDTPYQACTASLAVGAPDWSLVSAIPITEITDGVLVSSAECLDCRLRGTNVRPSFW
jgi:hypothetical protein